MKLTQRQRDILLAGAIGDAVGFVVEFVQLPKIIKQYGPNGLTLDLIHPEATLTVSDDTQMTLFSLEALHIEANRYQYLKSYKDWYYTQGDTLNALGYSDLSMKHSSLWHQRAPGMTCLSALRQAEPRPVPINDSKGCGAIMRTAPFGFMATFAEAWLHAKVQSRLTHGHPSGYLSSCVFSGLIQLIDGHGFSLDESMSVCVEHLKEEPMHEETLNAVYMAQDIAAATGGDTYSDIRRLGEGWVGEEALAIALYSVLVATSFEEVIRISINHSGDSDSTGSLAAQLYVALHGLPEKYQQWEQRLDVADAFAYVTDEGNYAKQV